jgi:hypothetical protein
VTAAMMESLMVLLSYTDTLNCETRSGRRNTCVSLISGLRLLSCFALRDESPSSP